VDEISFAEQFVPQGPLTVNDIFRRALAPDREEIEAPGGSASKPQPMRNTPSAWRWPTGRWVTRSAT